MRFTHVLQDILELLKPYFYQQIHIDKNSQSCKLWWHWLSNSCVFVTVKQLQARMHQMWKFQTGMKSNERKEILNLFDSSKMFLRNTAANVSRKIVKFMGSILANDSYAPWLYFTSHDLQYSQNFYSNSQK